MKRSTRDGTQRVGLARALSKLGYCSRSQARELIHAGKVRVNGRTCRNPQQWTVPGQDRIQVDSNEVTQVAKVYLMLNKPRGLITTVSDEQDRRTVFECLDDCLPKLSPVGRLDMASEGLLLFTNDTDWAAAITAPKSGLEKKYHVQIGRIADEALLARLVAGVETGTDYLRVKRASLLRHGSRNSWMEIVMTEGKNRHIRRLLAACDIEVMRLVRVAIGPLQLGELAKGTYRQLRADEVQALRQACRP